MISISTTDIGAQICIVHTVIAVYGSMGKRCFHAKIAGPL